MAFHHVDHRAVAGGDGVFGPLARRDADLVALVEDAAVLRFELGKAAAVRLRTANAFDVEVGHVWPIRISRRLPR